MELARILTGNFPLQATAIPVYDAALLADGELLMRHASWHSGENKFWITAYTAGATEAEDTIGITRGSSTGIYNQMEENSSHYHLTSTAPSVAISAGGNYMPAIINPHATYYAFWDQTDAINCSTAVSASTSWTLTSLENNIDGGWLYTTDGADSSATFVGELRYLTASAAGSCTADSAITVDTSTDVIKMVPVGHRLVDLNAEATGLSTTAAASSTIYLEILENWITNGSHPREAMNYYDHKGLSGANPAIFYGEIIQLKHAYRAVVV